jgi:maltose O-acetyltransferase
MPPRLRPLQSARFDLLLFCTNRIVANIPIRRLRLAYYRRVLDLSIGEGSYIFMGAFFDSRHGFTIGRNSVVGHDCRLDNRGGIVIGDNVSISAQVAILTGDHDVQTRDFAGRERPVRIGDYAFIGTRALLLPGVTVGKGAVVAAGAVVARDVAPYTIVAGNPAKQVGERTTDLDYDARYARLFH